MCENQTQELNEAGERAVRAELNRLLESVAFRGSKRCSDFLEYVVNHTISGPSGALKERLIGVELFQLPPDFDPGQHAIVRVTANEVRKKLARQYLADNGEFRPVRIDLPPGSYKAEFRWEKPTADSPAVAAAPPADKPSTEGPATDKPPADQAVAEIRSPRLSNRRAGVVAACAAVALAILAGAAAWRWLAAAPDSSEAEAGSIGRSVGAGPQSLDDLRISVGATNPYIDRSGWAWGSDRFFSGGSVLVRSSEKIARTLDPDIYRRLRQGEFRYDIPLKPGTYELHLHFAETGMRDAVSAESSGQGQRLFHVSANGKRILEGFDIAADAPGANVADERVFRDISPAEDGILHLSFVSVREPAVLSGIEVLPVSPGRVRPIRIRAGWPSSWADSAGRRWQADSYFTEGNALVRRMNPARESDGAEGDLPLYASERWGNFSYTVPVAEGKYRVTLKFCEGHYGPRNTGVGGTGSRLFDVYCNGAALLRNFDIFKEAGGEGKPLDRTFSGIRPTAQGKIVLTFVPVKGMACVNGIEIAEIAK